MIKKTKTKEHGKSISKQQSNNKRMDRELSATGSLLWLNLYKVLLYSIVDCTEHITEDLSELVKVIFAR